MKIELWSNRPLIHLLSASLYNPPPQGTYLYTDTFNGKISLDEIQKVLGKAKNNKAVGVDRLPNEVL